MNKTLRAIIYWTPRIIGILITALFTLLSFDVFVEGQPFWTSLLGLLIHLIPAAIMAGVLAISWRWERVGGILFILASLVYMMAFKGVPIAAYLWIALPLFVAGVLFLINWRMRKKAQEQS